MWIKVIGSWFLKHSRIFCLFLYTPIICIYMCRAEVWKSLQYSCHGIFWKKRLSSKVHIFWEGHNILRNLHRRFVLCSNGQIYSGDFAKFCGLLRIYQLYKTATQYVQARFLVQSFLRSLRLPKRGQRVKNYCMICTKYYTTYLHYVETSDV